MPMTSSSSKQQEPSCVIRSEEQQYVYQEIALSHECLVTITPSLQAGDGYVALYVKDAYFHLSNVPFPSRFLRCVVPEQLYQFWVLPFGALTTLSVVTKCVAAVAVLLDVWFR